MAPRLAVLVVLLALAPLAASGCGGEGDAASPAGPSAPGSPAPSPEAGAVAPPTQDVTNLLGPLRDAYGGVPGLGALVMIEGNVAALGATGVRKVGEPAALTTSDLFHLGGDVQTMTATLAALLVEAGTLTWSARLGDVLAGVPMHASYTSVTLEDLVAQRGGAPAQVPDDVLLAARARGDPAALRQAAVATLLARGPAQPAATFTESDVSFLLAAAMLERAASASWESLMASRVFAPLGITRCHSVTSDPGPTPSVPWGHVALADGNLTSAAPGGADEPPAALAPALGIRCSLLDWGRFVQVHLLGALGTQTTFLQPASFRKLQTPFDFSHALGWYAVARPWAGQQLALNYVSRSLSSFALAWVLPSKSALILVAANQGGAVAAKVADDTVANLVGKVVEADQAGQASR